MIGNVFLTFSSFFFFFFFCSFGRSKLKVQPLNGFQLIIEPDPSKLKKECFHEDGGYKAIFEAIQPCNAQKQVPCSVLFDTIGASSIVIVLN